MEHLNLQQLEYIAKKSKGISNYTMIIGAICTLVGFVFFAKDNVALTIKAKHLYLDSVRFANENAILNKNIQTYIKEDTNIFAYNLLLQDSLEFVNNRIDSLSTIYDSISKVIGTKDTIFDIKMMQLNKSYYELLHNYSMQKDSIAINSTVLLKLADFFNYSKFDNSYKYFSDDYNKEELNEIIYFSKKSNLKREKIVFDIYDFSIKSRLITEVFAPVKYYKDSLVNNYINIVYRISLDSNYKIIDIKCYIEP